MSENAVEDAEWRTNGRTAFEWKAWSGNVVRAVFCALPGDPDTRVVESPSTARFFELHMPVMFEDKQESFLSDSSHQNKKV